METLFSSALWLIIVVILMIWSRVTATEISDITKSEREALVQSEWWPEYTNTSSSHCKFDGITCNKFRRITHIELRYSQNVGNKFGKMNFSQIPKLKYLFLESDGLRGTIPLQICALSNLRTLSLPGNYLSGNIPSCLGELSKLKILDLSMNNLNGSIPSQLGSLKKLSYLNLSGNKRTGSIPCALSRLSQLRHLNLSSNNLSGFIPSCLGELSKLEILDLSMNNLNGSIPSQLGSLKNLFHLSLAGNKLTGSIPCTVSRLFQLTELDLSSNNLSGSIPSCLQKLSSLYRLTLSKNNLYGSIPSQLGNLRGLYVLSLDENEITGPIPTSIWSLTYLREIYLQKNQINGTIPPLFGTMNSLVFMNISFNRVVGKIPLEIGRLEHLELLDLRNNFFIGHIPNTLIDISTLHFLNLSYNSLSGYIPFFLLSTYHTSAFLGNKDLYISPLNPRKDLYNSPLNPRKKEIISRIVSFFIIFIVLFFLSYIMLLRIWLYCKKRVKPSAPNEKITKSKDTFSIWNYEGRIVYEEIVKVTENFDLKYCIGTGGYGSVYRAELPNGKVFAVKKLHHLEAEEPAFDKSFRNEVKLLTEVRHKNIIKLHGFCLHKRCMFLVYEYIERGSLFYALRNDVEALELNWSRRLDIVKDVADAMSYLHHHCSPSIIHRDLSTNNILLNDEMQAVVSDFGTARFLDPTMTNISTIAGTLGYIAPELAYTMILNEKCDVYSYGVVAMETIMGKHPQEIISMLATSSIEQVKLQEILDCRLPCPRNGLLIARILQVVSYALACLSPIPKLRPSMKHISDAFLNKKFVAFDKAFCEISLGQLRANYEASS